MPQPIEVKATKGQTTVATTYDFGGDLEEMRKLFGDEIVFSNARQSFKISLQALMRRGIDAGKDEATIAAEAAAWKPGVAAQRVTDPIAAITAKWATLSDEKRKEVMAKLRAMA